MRRIAPLLVMMMAFALVLPTASAQSMFADLSGTVTDTTGAIVPGAAITVQNTSSGVARKATTDKDGFFSVTQLPVGTYNVMAEAKGFRKWVGSGIALNSSDTKTLNVILAIGSMSETVEVNATTEQLVTVDSGEKSYTIDQKYLEEQSLVGRNSTELLKILPGATMSANGGLNKAAYSGEIIGMNSSIGGQTGGLSGVNINGQSVDITMDGQHTFDPGSSGSATPVNPNPAMISEMKVMTSNFSAENAKGPVVVNTNTKAGGNAFHGEGYLYARNSAMNAEDAFNKETETANQLSPGFLKVPSSYYYPGFNIGGPIVIPGTNFNKGRQKFFFFEGYENYHQTVDGGVARAFVPNQSMLNGDFSALANYTGPMGRPGVYTVPKAPAVGVSHGFDARAGCTISKSGVLAQACISPAAQQLLRLELPTVGNTIPASGFNYVQAYSVHQNSYQNVVRGDWNISDNTKAYITWSRQRETNNMPLGLWGGTGDWVVPAPSPVVGSDRSDAVNATFLHVFSPTMTAEGRFGYMKLDLPNAVTAPNKIFRADANFPLKGYFGSPDVPAIVSWNSGIPNLGDVGHGYHPGMIATKGIPSTSGNLTKVFKTHTTKYGFYYEHTYNTQDNWGQYMGVFDYSNWAGSTTGNAYADILMGTVGQAGYFEQALPPPSELAQNIAAFYAQDDWKLTRRISVQYGMRFEHYAKPYSPGFGLAVFNPKAYDPAAPVSTNPGVSWNAMNSQTPLSGVNSRLFFFSPRFGAAIDVFGNGRTVVRGGWGKFRAYDSVQSNSYTGPTGTALGAVTFSCGFGSTDCPTWESIDAHASGNCSAGEGCAPANVLGHPTLANSTFSAMIPGDDEQPLVTSYSLTIDQSLPAKFRLEASYVGNHSDFLQGTTNVDALSVGTLKLAPAADCGDSCMQALRPFPAYRGITGSVTAGKQQFDSFQASLHRNVGFVSLQANYTFSKALGDGWNLNNGTLTGALPDYGAHNLWGVLPIDRGQVFSASYVLNLPKTHTGSKLVDGFANGWQISGITLLESGAQLTNQSGSGGLNFNYSRDDLTHVGSDGKTVTDAVYNNKHMLGTGDITLYPLLTCNPAKGLGHNQFMNPNCFAPAPAGSFGSGNAPYLPGPMFWNTDISLLKSIKLTERQGLQFRFAAFNPLNHSLLSFANGDSHLNVQFNADGTLKNAATLGVATNHYGHRTLEMGVKYSF